MSRMTVVLENPEAIAEIEALMARFGLSADQVVERVILEAGVWMPLEVLGHPRSPAAEAKCGDSSLRSE